MSGFADSFIAGYTQGQTIKRQKDQDAQHLEDRKMQQVLLKHELDKLKIADKVDAYKLQREASGQQFDAVNGTPDAQLQPSQVKSQDGIPQMAGGVLPAMMPQKQPNPVQFPGLPPEIGGGSPGYSRTPQTMETLLQQQAMAKRTEAMSTPHDIAPGHTFGMPGQEPLMTGQPVAPARPAPLAQQYLDAMQRGDTETAQQIKAAMNAGDNAPRERFNVQPVTYPDGTNGLVRVNTDTGDATPVTLPDGAGAGRVTDTQRLSAAYLDRTKKSNVGAQAFEDGLLKLGPQVALKLPNLLKSEAGQQYTQGKDEFINAALRRESGAAIQQSEYDRYDRIYFVQPGDTLATIKKKQEARQRVIHGFKIAAGSLGNDEAQRQEIPGHPGTFAVSKDGGKTWKAE